MPAGEDAGLNIRYSGDMNFLTHLTKLPSRRGPVAIAGFTPLAPRQPHGAVRRLRASGHAPVPQLSPASA